MHNNDSVNWEENSELGVVKLHNFNSRFPLYGNPVPKKHELVGSTVGSTRLVRWPSAPKSFKNHTT